MCAGIGYLPGGSVNDGPAFYIKESPRELISICGGACMAPVNKAQIRMCVKLCPPPEWRSAGCDAKHEAYADSLRRERWGW